MFKNIARFAIKQRIPIIISFISFTLFMGIQIPDIAFDPNIKSMLPEEIDARKRLDLIEDIFGGSEFIQIGFVADDILEFSTLERIKTVTRKLERTDGIEKVISITNINNITSREGDLIVKKLIKRIPATENQIGQIRSDIRENDFIYGSLVSLDFSATVILAFISEDVDDFKLIKEVNKILEENPGDAMVYLGGLPVLRGELANNMQKDMGRFIPIGIVIMLLFLLFCFRELRGILLPFLIVIMSIIVAMGAISLLGWKIQLVTILLPVILIAVANDYGIHIMARYQYEVKQLPINTVNKDKRLIIENVMSSLGGPVLAAGLTTVAGFLTFTTHIVSPAKELGVLSAVGIIFSLAGSVLLIPAVLSLLPLSNYSYRKRARTVIDKILYFISGLVTSHPKRVVIFSLIFISSIIPGFYLLEIDTDPISFFNSDSDVVQSNNILEKYFGGSTNLSIVINGDIQDPKIMNQINQLEHDLKKRENIGHVTSIAQIIRQMNYVMNDNDPQYKIIPQERNTIAQYFLLYSFSGDPEDFEKMVDFEFRNAIVLARLSNPSTKILQEEFRYIREWIDNRSSTAFKHIGGFAEILLVLSYALVKGQMLSLILSLIIVGIIISVLFRSPYGGFMSILPIVLAILTLFGLMGYLNIKLSTVTSMISSLMIGVGVDYTIHFLWHYKAALTGGMLKEEAIMRTLNTSGKGIVFNAFSVIIGFLVLLISNFLPVRFFGFLVVTIIFTCLIGALLFLPALCVWIEPKWLNKRREK